MIGIVNYLAHFHLSYGDDERLLGALMGDYVKGPLQGRFSPGLEHGIWLHRKVDAFTDSHPQLQQLRRCFHPAFRRYSSIMTDVVFDHFLNLHWQQFHHQPLAAFSEDIYRLIHNHEQLLPAAKVQAANLVRYDVLGSYRHWQTVEGALVRISQRMAHNNPLAEAAAELDRHYLTLETGFLQFYPQLIDHCGTLIQSSSHSTKHNGQLPK